jgi:hypothetical protein
MKRLTVTLCSLLALSVIGCNDTATTNSAPPADTAAAKKDTPATATATPPPPMDPAAMQKAMDDYAAINEPHKMLATQIGKWNEEVSVWMDPTKPPVVSKSTCVNSMILGGRYQQSKHTGTFDKKPFEGVGTLGYDNTKKAFVSSWVDNMGSGIMYLEGPWDAASKSITLTGKMVDPTTGKDCSVREVMTFTDDKNQKMEMYATPAGAPGEMKMMEIKFTRP